jgi:type VI protein secretion system component Hcp
MSDEIKKPDETTDAPAVLSDTDLQQVAGGKVSVQDIQITHNIDKSSPALFESTAPAPPTTPPAK